MIVLPTGRGGGGCIIPLALLLAPGGPLGRGTRVALAARVDACIITHAPLVENPPAGQDNGAAQIAAAHTGEEQGDLPLSMLLGGPCAR